MAEKHDQLQISAKALRLKGILFKQKGEIELAKESYEKSLKICEKNNFRRDLANVLHSLGNISYNQDTEKSEDYYRRSIDIKEDLGDIIGVQKSILGIALIHKKRGELEEAEKLYRKSLKIAQDSGYKLGESTALSFIAGFLKQRGELEEAEKIYRQALAI